MFKINFEIKDKFYLDPSLLNDVLPNFWPNTQLEKEFSLVFNNQVKSNFKINVQFPNEKNGVQTFKLNNKDYTVKFIELDAKSHSYQCDINGHRVKLSYFKDNETNMFNLFVNDRLYEFKLEDKKYEKEQSGSQGGSSDSNDAVAPMPGLVDKVNVKVGEKVKKGDPLVVMIAMKMEYVIKASRDGVIKSINCSVGQNVKKSHKLVSLAD